MNRAYSILTVKAVEDDERVIRGTATTPRPDRVGDVVEPMGVQFRNPMPLLHQHDSNRPVGTVTFDKPTKDGITFEARLPKIDEPGPLKDRVDTAWGEVKAGLVRAVSIGFRALEYAFMDEGGIRFLSSEVLELSLVTVPANADATISQIKSIDAPMLAATGKEPKATDRPVPPGVTGKQPLKQVKLMPKEGKPMAKTIAEQISAFEATRGAKAAELETIMTGSEGETLDADHADAADGLVAELKSIDDHLKRLRLVESLKASTAKPVQSVETERKASDARSPIIVKNTQKLEPGIRFARVAKCVGMAKGNMMQAEQIAIQRYSQDDAVVNTIKAAVAAGANVSSNWAEDLVGDATSVYADFVEFLRPQTILGKFGANGVPSLRRVPFRVPLVSQTAGGAGYWVGEGLPKPLTNFDFSRTTLEPLKVANIAVLTMEVLRDSSPSAEMIVRDQLAAALRERMDTDFIAPTKTASAGVSPASITNGVTAPNSAGNDADSVREDIRTIFQAFIAADNAPTTGVWIMSATTALSLSLMQNPLGQSEFPGIGMTGGTFFGMPAIVSEYVPTVTAGSYVFLVNASDIYLADEGGITIDMSREASLQMDNAPATQTALTGTGTSLVSLWQTNSVGFLAERTINWAKRRSSAVAVIDTVNWGAGT
jgi:HK97 family phage prohead protease